ncbi:MAG: lysylphosphatidylglycerol synthase transmembrane domain-containing protein [Nanoarchaeota archaeon]
MNRRAIQVIILLAIGIFFLIIWARFINFQGLTRTLSQTHSEWIIFGVPFYLAGILVRSLRWKLLLQHLTKLEVWTSFKLYLSGQMFNYLIPLRLGEVAKSVFLKQKKGVHITRSFPTIIIDKVLDLLILLIVVFILFGLVQNTTHIPIVWIFIIIVILGITSLIYTIHNERPFIYLIQKLLFFAPQFSTTIQKHTRTMIAELRIIKQKTSTLLTALALSFLGLVLDVAFFYSMLKAIGLTGIPLLHAFFGYTLIIISYTIPTPPAQLGSNEILYLVVFSVLLGMDTDKIAAVTILVHAATTIILVLGGIISLRLLKISPKELFNKKTYMSSSNRDIYK